MLQRFDLPQDSYCEIDAFNIEGIKVRELIASSLPAGSHELSWDGRDSNGVVMGGIYEIRMKVRANQDGDILYSHSVWGDLYLGPDTEQTGIGYTDAEGVLEYENRLIFPGIYEQPLLVHTTDSPDSLETFTCIDTIFVAAIDTSTHQSVEIKVPIINGENEFHLVFVPDQERLMEASKRDPIMLPKSESVHILSQVAQELPDAYKLYYPYPNPFN